MARDLAAMDDLVDAIRLSIACIEELSAGTREIREKLEWMATMDDDHRSPLTFAEFMDVHVLNEVRRIERSLIEPGIDMAERDLDVAYEYLVVAPAAAEERRGRVTAVNALANRLERCRLSCRS